MKQVARTAALVPTALTSMRLVIVFVTVLGLPSQLRGDDRVDRAVNVLMTLCLAKGSVTISHFSVDPSTNQLNLQSDKGSFVFEKREAQGLVDGIDASLSSLGADQAKRASECMKPYIGQIMALITAPSSAGVPPPAQRLEQINNVLSKRIGFSLGTKLVDNRTANSAHLAGAVVSGDFYLFSYLWNSNSKVRIDVYVDRQRTIKVIELVDEYYEDVKNEVLKSLYLRMLTDWNHGDLPLFTSSTNRDRYNFEYIKATYEVRDSPWSLGGATYGYLRQNVWYELNPVDKSCPKVGISEAPVCDENGRYNPWAAPPKPVYSEVIVIALSD
jgi:hypothetical protein